MCNCHCLFERHIYGSPDTHCEKPKCETCPMEDESYAANLVSEHTSGRLSREDRRIALLCAAHRLQGASTGATGGVEGEGEGFAGERLPLSQEDYLILSYELRA